MQSIFGTANQAESHAKQRNMCSDAVAEQRKSAHGIEGAPVEPILWFDTNERPRLVLSYMGYIVNNARCSVILYRQSVDAAQKRFNPPSWRIFGLAGLSNSGRYIVEMMARSGAARLSNAHQVGPSVQDTSANYGAGSLGSLAFAELTRSLAQWASQWRRGWMKSMKSKTETVM